MDTADDLFLDLVESVALDVLGRIGDDPDARYAFFQRFVALAQEVVADADKPISVRIPADRDRAFRRSVTGDSGRS
jgi:hypothetical protein